MAEDRGRTWSKMLLATLLAIAAFHLSVMGVLFLLPLEWIRFRYGQRSFTLGVLLAMVGIVGINGVILTMSAGPWTALDTVFLWYPVVPLIGWAAVVWMERLGWRLLYRLLVVTGAAGLVLFPLIASLLGNDAFVQAVGRMLDEVWNTISQAPSFKTGVVLAAIDRGEFFAALKGVFLGGFLAGLFLFWAFTGRVSQVFGSQWGSWTLKNFFVPAQGAWVLLGVWGVIFAQSLWGQPGGAGPGELLQYALVNLALIALTVHCLAGWGIVQALMDRWRWPLWGQAAVKILLILVVVNFRPGLIVVLVGLSILAVLELWVNFRNRTQGVGL